MATCHGCDAELAPNKGPGQPRKWCSQKCRKLTLYSKRCIDCGGVCNTDGRVTHAAERCFPCSRTHQKALMATWIIESMREWHELFGAPPSSVDWNQPYARLRMADSPKYSQRVIDRYKGTGRPWPNTDSVQRIFGSWNKGLIAAGFTPLTRKEHALGHWGLAAKRSDEAA